MALFTKIFSVLALIADSWPNIQKWWKERKRVREVDKITKAIDSDDDKSVVEQLRKLADEIERKNKLN